MNGFVLVLGFVIFCLFVSLFVSYLLMFIDFFNDQKVLVYFRCYYMYL